MYKFWLFNTNLTKTSLMLYIYPIYYAEVFFKLKLGRSANDDTIAINHKTFVPINVFCKNLYFTEMCRHENAIEFVACKHVIASWSKCAYAMINAMT